MQIRFPQTDSRGLYMQVDWETFIHLKNGLLATIDDEPDKSKAEQLLDVWLKMSAIIKEEIMVNHKIMYITKKMIFIKCFNTEKQFYRSKKVMKKQINLICPYCKQTEEWSGASNWLTKNI